MEGMAGPTLDELRVFDCAARCGSISAAARELGVSQQAVSARLRGLERMVGFTLVDRSPAGITLTPGGQSVLTAARELLVAEDTFSTALAALRGDPEGTSLCIAASQTVAAHLLPGWVIALRNRRIAAGEPPIRVHLHTANSEQVCAMVRNGEADIGFIEHPVIPADLSHSVVRHDELVVAVAPTHPWASRESLTLEEVASDELVAREGGSGTRAALELAVEQRLGRRMPEPLLTLATEASIRSAVAQSVAPAVLSELTVLDDVRLGRIRAIPFAPDPLARPIAAVWRGGRHSMAGVRRELLSVASQ